MGSQMTPVSSTSATVSLETPETPSDPGFQYKPLLANSLRLISLEPKRKGEDPSLVRCQLVHRTFASKPQYEAISYTWANEEPSKIIFVDNESMRVTPNLHAALSQFAGNQPQNFWADAVCIDQSNITERNNQVGFMDVIFRRAACVRIWLGYPTSVNKLTYALERWMESTYISEELLNLSYWRRAWIVQEIGLSSSLTVHIGSESLSWERLIAQVGQQTRHSARKRLLKLDSKRRGRHGVENHLEVLLEDFQDCECKDPRDKIFAFLGLAHDSNDSIHADYSKSTLTLLLDVLQFFHQKKNLHNYSENYFDRSMRIMKFSRLVHQLLGNVNWSPSIAGEYVVQARGAIGATIILLGPSYHSLFANPADEKKWTNSFDCKEYSTPYKITGLRQKYETYYPVLFNLSEEQLQLYCGINPKTLFSIVTPGAGYWKQEEREWDHTELKVEAHWGLKDVPSLEIQTESTDEPRIFLGTNSVIGLVPLQAREGDVLCHFWNCDVVALLRKVRSGLKSGGASVVYKIIGRVHLCTGSWNEDLRPDYQRWVQPPEYTTAMHVELDLNTLHLLTR